MRKWIAIALACLLAAGLFACGEAQEEPTSAPPGTTVTATQTTATETTTTTTTTTETTTTQTTCGTKPTTAKPKKPTTTEPTQMIACSWLNYDANGGVGAPSTKQVSVVGNVPFPPITLSVQTPTRENFVFSHWNTKRDGSGKSFQPGGTYTIGELGTVLYAQWTAAPTNTTTTLVFADTALVYDANGGTGAPGRYFGAVGSVIVIPGTVPTKPGAVFSHWNTAQDGSGKRYSPGDSFRLSNYTVFYAQWEEEP